MQANIKPSNQPKEIIMFNRNIFTESKPTITERILDVLLAVVIGLIFAVGIVHSLDALFV